MRHQKWSNQEQLKIASPTPEIALVVAVLDRAISDSYPVSTRIKSTCADLARKRADRILGIQWIEDESEEEWSFYWCCDILGLCRKVFKEKVVEMIQARPKGVKRQLMATQSGYRNTGSK